MSSELELIRPELRITYNVAMTLLAFITVCLRLHVRYVYKPRKSRPNSKRKHSVAYILGDVFMVIGMIICISFAGSDIWLQATVIREPLAASGRNFSGWLVLRVMAAKILTYQYLIGTIGLYSIKTSFICYYFDAREGFSRNLRITLYVTTGLIVANFVTIMGYLVGKCRPFSNYWALAHGNCLISTPLRDNVVVTGTHIFTDIIIMIMGFLVIRTLRYQTHMLPAITFIFILGVLTIIVNSLRCGLSITLIDQLKTGNVILGNKAAEKLAEWASVITLAEHSVALIAVSLPSLRVWWRAWAMEEKVRERRGAEVILEMNMGNTTVIEAGAGSKERSRDSDGFTPGVYSTPTSPTYHDHDKHEVHEHEQGKRHSGCVSCGGRAVEKVKELGKAATSPIHGHFKKPSWTGSTAAEQAPVVLRPPPELAKFDFDFQR